MYRYGNTKGKKSEILEANILGKKCCNILQKIFVVEKQHCLNVHKFKTAGLKCKKIH
jgi:hypothetical protein